MKRPSFRTAWAAEKPLVTPLAHDALTARLIKRAGFKAFNVGGSTLLAARYGLPDVGLIGLRDMIDGMRELAAATDLPFMADADDGYGDVKAVAKTVMEYEAIGVGGMLIEDQLRDVKRQRAEKSLAVADDAVIEAKLRVALQTRASRETVIIGRTDAYGAVGLDEALRRAERFLSLGVDGVFVAGLRKVEELERVGRTLRGATLLAAMFEGMDTPWLTPAELGAMGFAQISYPTSLILRVVGAVEKALGDLRAFSRGEREMERLTGAAEIRASLDGAVELARWMDIETGFTPQGRSGE
ncbi:MAG: isocitrate lyase/PEP mutase family protein [Alphaproteobacteria bacterium]|nr:isocitrate lyase/PEP mutase family protein [Alphaproteobacteria bacterium]